MEALVIAVLLAVIILLLIIYLVVPSARAMVGDFVDGFVAGASEANGQKRCSRCGGIVPNSAKPGDRCSHCGAVWSYERTVKEMSKQRLSLCRLLASSDDFFSEYPIVFRIA